MNIPKQTIFRSFHVLFALITFLAFQELRAQVNQGRLKVGPDVTVIKLSGNWYFTTRDNPASAAFQTDLNEWKTVPITGWDAVPEYRNHKGVVWYRLEMDIAVKKAYAFFLPVHTRGAGIFFNGRLIRETRANAASGKTPPVYGKPEILIIPAQLVRPGRNTLALRAGALDNFTGFEDSFYFGTVDEIQFKWVRHLLWYGALAFISLFLAGYFLLHFLQRPRERYYLYFAGVNLVLGIWILGFQGLSFYLVDRYWFYVLTTYPTGLLISFMILNFMHRFFDIRKRWPAYVLEVFYLTFAVLVSLELLITGRIRLFNTYLFIPMIMSMVFIALYLIGITLYAVRLDKPFARRILIGVMGYGSALVYSMLVFANVIRAEPLLNEGFFIMVTVFATVLARRFSDVHSNLEAAHGELQDLNQNLENRVQERTASLREAQSRIVQLEREATERQMAGGFAHEIRNALSGTRLLLEQALGRDRPGPGESLSLNSSRLLKEMFHYLKDVLKPDELENCLRLMKRVFDNEQRMENITEISYQSVLRGLAITREILDYSVIGQEKAKNDAVNVSGMLAELARNYSEEFKGDRISIEIEIPDGDRPLVLQGHEPHFHSALTNIILNARDAIREKVFAPDEDRVIRIHGEHLRDSIELRISDNGVGMDSEHSEKIYDAFFTTRPQSGIGLGMGIVRKIVSLYDGDINVESEPGRGTTFTISFDCRDAA